MWIDKYKSIFRSSNQDYFEGIINVHGINIRVKAVEKYLIEYLQKYFINSTAYIDSVSSVDAVIFEDENLFNEFHTLISKSNSKGIFSDDH